jgi:hypothetical protein
MVDHLVIKMCRAYGDMSQRFGTPRLALAKQPPGTYPVQYVASVQMGRRTDGSGLSTCASRIGRSSVATTLPVLRRRLQSEVVLCYVRGTVTHDDTT